MDDCGIVCKNCNKKFTRFYSYKQHVARNRCSVFKSTRESDLEDCDASSESSYPLKAYVIYK